MSLCKRPLLRIVRLSARTLIWGLAMVAIPCSAALGSEGIDRSSSVMASQTLFGSASSHSPRLGKSISEEDLHDLTIYPDGRGLPPGSGNAAKGAIVFERHCTACHGKVGQGGLHADLVGGDFLGRRTIGSFWPYATTLFDYVRRAMPYTNPGVLDADETYAVVAFLLARNEIIGRDVILDANTLPAVRMPARERFVSEYPLP